jgi:hypothetical protein
MLTQIGNNVKCKIGESVEYLWARLVRNGDLW